MATATPRWGFDRLDVQEVGAQVKINFMFRIWDMLINPNFGSIILSDPPDGYAFEKFIFWVRGTGTGAWTGHDGELAVFIDGIWYFYPTPLGFGGVLVDDFIVWTGGPLWETVKDA